jgi:hypothetical protein
LKLREKEMSKSFEDQNMPQPKKVHRLSRRTAITTGAVLAGSALVGAGSGEFITKGRTAQTSGITPSVVSQTHLSINDPLRTRLFASSSMQSLIQKHGVDAISKNSLIHVKYANTNTEAVGMSIQTASNQPRLAWAYFKPSSPDFKILQFGFVPTGDMVEHFKYSNELIVSGRATFFTEGDAVISSAIFRNDTLVSTAMGNSLTNVSNIGAKTADQATMPSKDWTCVEECILGIWPSLPGVLKAVCAASCAGCLTGTNIIITCSICGGCLGGAGLTCILACP